MTGVSNSSSGASGPRAQRRAVGEHWRRFRKSAEIVRSYLRTSSPVTGHLLITPEAGSPSGGQRLARFESGQPVSRLEGVLRAGHRLRPQWHAPARGAQGVVRDLVLQAEVDGGREMGRGARRGTARLQ